MVTAKKWAGRIATAAFVLVTVGFAALFAWPGTYNINNGSMHPTVPVGTKVFTQQSSQYEAGDIITFKAIEVAGESPLVVTHRLVDFNPDGTLITQGDANESVDYPAVPVYQADIIGKVVYQIPIIGGVQLWMMANPLLWMPVVLLLVAVVIWPMLGNKPTPSSDEPAEASSPQARTPQDTPVS